MADIVERLRRPDILLYQYAASVTDDGALLHEAADEIERLREALREIVKHSDYDDPVRDMALAALGEKE